MSATAAGLLAYVFQTTDPKIKENLKIEKEKQLKFVLPGASILKKKVVKGKEFIIGYTAQELIGIACEKDPSGYGGRIKLLIGISPKGRILRLAILFDKETPGLGKKIHEYWFRQQFVGKRAAQIQLTKDTPQGTIEAISSATISSRAVTSGIHQAVEEVLEAMPQLIHFESSLNTQQTSYNDFLSNFLTRTSRNQKISTCAIRFLDSLIKKIFDRITG